MSTAHGSDPACPTGVRAAAPIGVYFVDDHKCVVWGLERLVAGEQPRMRVAGKAHNRRDALEGIRVTTPDVVLLDLDLGGHSSLDFLPELLELSAARIIVLTGNHDTEVLSQAVTLGARGIVLKDEPADMLIKAIDHVHHGELWLERATMARMLDMLHVPKGAAAPPADADALTLKERQIVAAIVERRGANSKAVAADLFISDHTLRNHLTTIYRKLDVRNRLELVMYALEHGLGKDRAVPAAKLQALQ
jgi:DNA-binding NarL/FixJ family response regulator